MNQRALARLPHPVDDTLHGVVDYTAGALMQTVLPRLLGVSGTRSARQIRRAGRFHTGYSLITRYPLGAAKVLPFQAHLVIDAVGAVALAATPFMTGQYRQGARQWLPHVGLCLFELASLAITDPTGRGSYHGDVAAVRRANAEDPHRKVTQGPIAVRPAAMAA
jgi:hypothetical protein